jgi:G patch domain and KOW motifs-containing protein
MIVIDVVSPTHCSCQTEDGIFLDSVDISMLETVIPRDDPAYVMVVSGKRKGQVCLFHVNNF